VKALFLLGPTASGKSAVALALSRRFPAEIVSVDSAQVYRGMDLGTAKPTLDERSQVPHHLIDIVEPTEAYSAGRFCAEAAALIAAITARGRLPILAGGTMLYVSALTRGLARLPPADRAIRAGLEAEAARVGWPALHAQLGAVDAVTAARLDPNDAQRIQRALEVHRLTGQPLSLLQQAASQAGPALEALKVALEPADRGVLHQRIAARFRAMLAAGLVAELEGLRARMPLTAELPSMRAVGYRQAWQTLEGLERASTLEARGIAATRQLAKRQLTWLRSMRDIERFDCLRPDLVAAVQARVERFIATPSPRSSS
jgi:tRNA dimethylallyltransferase